MACTCQLLFHRAHRGEQLQCSRSVGPKAWVNPGALVRTISEGGVCPSLLSSSSLSSWCTTIPLDLFRSRSITLLPFESLKFSSLSWHRTSCHIGVGFEGDQSPF